MRLLAFFLACVLTAGQAAAFCGFYVAKADADLFNSASKVIYVRDGDRSVITMVSDYEGEPAEFAMVVPTPSVLGEKQIHVTRQSIVEHMDAYTAPRLVEYFDDNPCAPKLHIQRALSVAEDGAAAPSGEASLGVTVEASYTVGEYDIQILSATQSDGLATWLTGNGYKLPDGAERALGQYIRAGMKFFVAKVNLAEHDKLGGGFLRPLQIAFESPDFMLPIRLGMLNAKGPQDLILWTMTRTGRVETANYRTTKMPTDFDVPLFVEDEFADVYKAGFDAVIAREGGSGVVMEYAWDMNWCDPCAADPLPVEDLVELGAFWLLDSLPADPNQRRIFPGPARDVFVTRLHARYDEESFPEDLMLRVTDDRENFQGRYVMRHPWKGEASCDAAEGYFASLADRFEQEAQMLARFTRWDISEIRAKMRANGQDASFRPKSLPWYERIWKDR
ncbi:MAG: DUF2330 domain-containing protein [Pseudomonadota bacterium]